MRAAAVAALHGIHPLSVLSIKDPVEEMMMGAVIAECETIQAQRSNRMAAAIVMGLAHVLFGGRSG